MTQENTAQDHAPFAFVAASYLIRIRPESAKTLAQLAKYLREVPEESIFYHTYQSLESHHYTVYSNDFAQWVVSACNEPVLGEELGSIDVRDYVSLEELRAALAGAVESYIAANPQSADRIAFEPFYFSEAIEIVVPLDDKAATLAELADGIRRQSLQTLHYHFISSRLRLQLRTNDFSNWITTNLGNTQLAKNLDRIDIYTNTLEGIRKGILEKLQPWIPRLN